MYIELEIQASREFSEILIAELGELGFDTFEENEAGFKAYIPESHWDQSASDALFERYFPGQKIYKLSKIEKVNWNEEWEKNFQPIQVGNKCRVRASFHPIDPSFPIEVVINPKMSFGTGHHQTTSMMMQHQLELKHTGKKVMDIGCGTSILAILSSKLGASEVFAFDIEDWAYENSRENVELNGCNNVVVEQGSIKSLAIHGSYDIILANINKNVLLSETKEYLKYLTPDGILVLSGFYETDIPDLEEMTSILNLKRIKTLTQDRWASAQFQKINT